MEKTATLSSKNQVTIPRAVRTALGLKAGERVIFHLQDDGCGPVVTLRRVKRLEELAGSVPTPKDVEGLPWEEIRARAWTASGKESTGAPSGA